LEKEGSPGKTPLDRRRWEMAANFDTKGEGPSLGDWGEKNSAHPLSKLEAIKRNLSFTKGELETWG